jgi:hypothetical protein
MAKSKTKCILIAAKTDIVYQLTIKAVWFSHKIEAAP